MPVIQIQFMVTVYVLVDPRNNNPFYVGSTVNPKSRLASHWRGHEGTKEKRAIIKEIYHSGLKLQLLPILVCSKKAAHKCETHIYNLLTIEGYNLTNDSVRIDYKYNRSPE